MRHRLSLGRWAARRTRHRSRGQAMVEFAIVSIVLLLIVATAIDFGRVFYTQITAENAARAGALIAARAPDSYSASWACAPVPPGNQVGCAIDAQSRGSGVKIQPSQVTVTCENRLGGTVACPGSPQLNTRSRVTVEVPFGFLMPLLTAVLGNTVDVTASVAADQQHLPPAATFIPGPTPAPTPVPTPAPTPAPTPVPTPAPTPVPCVPGVNAPMPDLVEGRKPGTTETVKEARKEWDTAGFSAGNFAPLTGSDAATVLTVILTDTGLAPVLGQCYPISTRVTVTHT